MTRSDLDAACFTEVKVSKALWAAATLLAGARSASNSSRAPQHDRGYEGNRNVDLHGAFGELLLQRTLRQIANSDGAHRYMCCNMFVAGGGAKLANRPDLRFEDDGSHFGIDAKTFDCAANKRYFAINDKKHLGLRDQAYAYFAVLAPANGRRAVLSSLVPYADVDNWGVQNLRNNGTPSRIIPIDDFVQSYCPPKTSIESLREDVYKSEEIEGLTSDPKLRKYLCQLIPVLATAI